MKYSIKYYSSKGNERSEVCLFSGVSMNIQGAVVVDRYDGPFEDKAMSKFLISDRQSNLWYNLIKRYPGMGSPLKGAEANAAIVEQARMLGKTWKHLNKTKETTLQKRKEIMKTFEIKRVLIPTDFSETGALAMEHAIFLASLFKARLYLLHVVEAFEYTYSIYDPEIRIRDTEEINDSVNKKLEKLAAGITKEYGTKVNVIVGSGRPSSGITDAIKENNIDLVVMGTHGAKGFEELFIGSNSHRVVNMSTCPVITIQTHAKNLGFRNIVMPIDDLPHSREKVDYVIKLASKYGSRIHILGLQNSDDAIDEKRFKIKLDSVEKVVKKSGLPYERVIRTAKNIAAEAMNYSDKVDADLIVIMTDHESNLTGMFLGNLSKQIVNHSKIPVMSIRPQKGYYGNGYYPFGSE